MSILKREFSKLIDSCLEKEVDKVNSDKYRLKYHLMPPIGWLNDPNGLCQFKGEYHVFYQYSPFDANGGLKFWGHYKSKDMIEWEDLGTCLYPDTPHDCHGVYSGSAFVENNRLYFYYTGNVKHVGNYDYINNGRGHNTIMVTSEDGINFNDKKVLLENIDYPSNMTCHVRDPKVFKKNDKYFMVLGARDENHKGCILLYNSDDLENWSFLNTISSNEKFGYMWECPDLFELKDECSGETKSILCISPQGIEADGYKFNNIYQSGYFLGNMNLENGTFDFGEFIELDRGFDFYAPQTFIDEKGRTILIGWMGLPDIDEEHYTNPTTKNGWLHALTIPRELVLINNKVYQRPIKELRKLRGTCISKELKSTGEYNELKGEVYELDIEFNNDIDSLKINLKSDCNISFDKNERTIKLSLGESGYGRKTRVVTIDRLNRLQIFSDTSSLEIFVNNGEEVFTTRVYSNSNNDNINISGNLEDVKINMYELGEYKYV